MSKKKKKENKHKFKFIKKWTPDMEKKIRSSFSKWEKDNLNIIYGKRRETIEQTYGFKEVTISTHSLLKNIWVIAEYKREPRFHFEWVAVTIDGLIIVEFADEDNKKMNVCIGFI